MKLLSLSTKSGRESGDRGSDLMLSPSESSWASAPASWSVGECTPTLGLSCLTDWLRLFRSSWSLLSAAVETSLAGLICLADRLRFVRTSCFFRRDAAELLWSLINLIGLSGAPSGSGSAAGVSRHLGARKLRISLCLGPAVSWLACLCRWGTRLPVVMTTRDRSSGNYSVIGSKTVLIQRAGSPSDCESCGTFFGTGERQQIPSQVHI
jgi:hypothetical protein